MWYMLHQQADEIIAERHREADRRRLAREATARSSDEAGWIGSRRLDRSRAAGARLALATSRFARRVAVALDPATDGPAVGDRTC